MSDQIDDNIYSSIFVSLPTREVISLYNIPMEMTVLHLKSWIELHSGIPSSVQCLQYLNNSELQDDRTLLSYAIKSRSQLILTFPATWISLFFAAWHGDVREVFFSGVILADTYRYTDDEQIMLNRLISNRSFFALMISARQGHHKLLEELFENGADITRCSQFGRNPLHIAAWHGHYDCVNFLLNINCPVVVYDVNDKTSIQLAAQNNHHKCQRRIWLHMWNLRSQLHRNLQKESRFDVADFKSELRVIEEFIVGPSFANCEVNYEKILLTKLYYPFALDREEQVKRARPKTAPAGGIYNYSHSYRRRTATNTAIYLPSSSQLSSFYQLPSTSTMSIADNLSKYHGELGLEEGNERFERWFEAKKMQVEYILECNLKWSCNHGHQDIDITFDEWLTMKKRRNKMNEYRQNDDEQRKQIRCEKDYDPAVFLRWFYKKTMQLRLKSANKEVERVTAVRRNRGMTFSQWLEIKRKREQKCLLTVDGSSRKTSTVVVIKPSSDNINIRNSKSKHRLTFEEWVKMKDIELNERRYREAWLKLKQRKQDRKSFSCTTQNFDQWLNKKIEEERTRRLRKEEERRQATEKKMEKDNMRKIENELRFKKWKSQKLTCEKEKLIKINDDQSRQQTSPQRGALIKKSITFNNWLEEKIEDELIETIKIHNAAKTTITNV